MVIRIIRVQDKGAVLGKRGQQLGFCAGGPVNVAKEFQMVTPHVRDDPDRRAGDVCQPDGLPFGVHSQFQNRDLVRRGQPQDRLRKPDSIVQIADRLQKTPALREGFPDHLFRGGFPVTPRDGNDRNIKTPSVKGRQILIGS